MRLKTTGLISTLALELLALPLPVEVQQAGKVHRIGIVKSVGSPERHRRPYREFLQRVWAFVAVLAGRRHSRNMAPEQESANAGIYLPRRHAWLLRMIGGGVPAKPETGDRGPVTDALWEIVDAAGGVEFSRLELHRVIAVAKEEFNSLNQIPNTQRASNWGGATTPAVYYTFYHGVYWTRTLIDRFEDLLRPALSHDSALWNNLQRIRSEAGGQEFADARDLAGIALHKWTSPYSGFAAKVEGGKLLHPIVDRIANRENLRANLRFASGRHAEALIEEYWEAVCRFTDRLLDVFYPPPASTAPHETSK